MLGAPRIDGMISQFATIAHKTEPVMIESPNRRSRRAATQTPNGTTNVAASSFTIRESTTMTTSKAFLRSMAA